MNNRHLEYQIKVPITICTDKTKEQLLNFLEVEINHLEGIYTLIGNIEIEAITLCDCDAFECTEEEYNR